MITGASLIACVFMFMGANGNRLTSNGRFDISVASHKSGKTDIHVIDTRTGDTFQWDWSDFGFKYSGNVNQAIKIAQPLKD